MSHIRPGLGRPARLWLAASALLIAGGHVQAFAQQTVPVRSALDGPEPARSGDTAWFGLRLPGPETDPVQGVLDMTRADLPARPTSYPKANDASPLNGRSLYHDVATIVGFSHESRAAGEYLWGRVTGRPAYDRTIDWTATQLRAAGLGDVRREPFTATLSLPTAGEIRLLGSDAMGAGSRDIPLRSAMVQGVGPVNGTVTAPLVYVGQGTDADLAGRDLRSKIAVIVATPEPSLYAPIPARRTMAAMQAGAVGVIEVLIQAGNLKSFDRDRHGCGKQLCFTVGGEDGFFLQTILGEAARSGRSVSARLTATSETIERPVTNVVATIPGKTDRTVIINAHADGWFGGADDNASGLAVMIALAQHFTRAPKLERTLVFVASAGHHSPGANGLAAFRAAHDKDYVAKADLIVNIEHPAQVATMRSYVADQNDNFGMRTIPASGDLPKQIAINNRAPFLMDLWRQGIDCFGLDAQRLVDTRLPGELRAFLDTPDIAQTQMIASGALYHTSGDDLHSIPPEGLERAARFHAYFIEKVANAPAGLLRGGTWKEKMRCPPLR